VSDIITRGVLGLFGLLSLTLGPKVLDGSILLKFLSVTRTKSKSLDTLDDLLRFRVQKL